MQTIRRHQQFVLLNSCRGERDREFIPNMLQDILDHITCGSYLDHLQKIHLYQIPLTFTSKHDLNGYHPHSAHRVSNHESSIPFIEEHYNTFVLLMNYSVDYGLNQYNSTVPQQDPFLGKGSIQCLRCDKIYHAPIEHEVRRGV